MSTNTITSRKDKNKKKRMMMKGERTFYAINNAVLMLALLIVAYPIIYVFSASFSSPSAVISGRVVLLPVEPSLDGYRAVFRDSRIFTGYGNTIFYTVVGTAVNLFMTILCAYPLSRKDFIGKGFFMFFVTFTMLFSGGMLPTYLLIQNLELINTRWVMIIPGAISVFNVIVLRTFYQTNIPDELLEAAFLDGCNNIRFILQIVLPLSKAATAVIALFYSVGHWNSYMGAFLYLTDRNLFPLQIILREILIQNETATMDYDPELESRKQGIADLLKYSLIIVASLPIWCIYPFIQKHFVKGVMIGSIKG